MINLTLYRSKDTKNSTHGSLWHGDKFLCFTIEDGFHFPKIKGITRIPQGRYKCKKSTDTKFNAEYKAKLGHDWVMRILNVPDFDGIEVHIGNNVGNTDGCLLLNSLIAYDLKGDNFYGEGSKTAYTQFYAYITGLNDNDIWIEIKDCKL